MSFWTAMVVIAGIFAIVEMVKAKNGIVKDKDGNESRSLSHDGEAQREIAELRERIKVLERIATDKNSEAERLAKKIEDLRED